MEKSKIFFFVARFGYLSGVSSHIFLKVLKLPMNSYFHVIVYCARRGENELFLARVRCKHLTRVLNSFSSRVTHRIFFNKGMTGPFLLCESERGLGISSCTQPS